MKNLAMIFLMFVTLFLIWGCPYESTVPIDQASIKINTSLLGNWTGTGKDSSKVSRFYQVSPYLYGIESDSMQMTAHISNVDGEKFLNVKFKSKDGASSLYYIYRYILTSENQLYLFPISDALLKTKFSNSKNLKSYIQANRSRDSFYDKPGILEKLK